MTSAGEEKRAQRQSARSGGILNTQGVWDSVAKGSVGVATDFVPSVLARKSL